MQQQRHVHTLQGQCYSLRHGTADLQSRAYGLQRPLAGGPLQLLLQQALDNRVHGGLRWDFPRVQTQHCQHVTQGVQGFGMQVRMLVLLGPGKNLGQGRE
jgi:hypothetical protein